MSTPPGETTKLDRPWYRLLGRYHWFVLAIAGLGWLFDTMDQQLFNLARMPAMRELLGPGADVNWYGGVTTSIFLLGWAVGGLIFGVMGDRIGRARTMLFTILVYSLFTGLSALSTGLVDFALYRFLTGLGVGGEFAVGVALVAEVIPAASRPYALGFLQSLSTVGNITAALLSIAFGHLESQGVLGNWNFFGIQLTAWRAMFLAGSLPALLAVIIRGRLREPEGWRRLAEQRERDPTVRLGSFRELFGNPLWRRRAIVGMLLATCGVIGLWGIGFFVIDLSRSVFREHFQEQAIARGQHTADRDLCRWAATDPERFVRWSARIRAEDLIGPQAGSRVPERIWKTLAELAATDPRNFDPAAVAATFDRDPSLTPADRAALAEYLAGPPGNPTAAFDAVEARIRSISGKLALWSGYVSIVLNIGGFFGMYFYGYITQRIGRRPAFAIAFVCAAASTVFVFARLQQPADIFWMIPIMGYFLFSLFGGFAIYFPELFPTRLRSTGVSFCYNVGRAIAALGPLTLGLLASAVFQHTAQPLRYSGMAMCVFLLLAVLALPFAPETRGQPLPE